MGVVAAAIAASYGLGRLPGLRHRMAVLVACGNSICGNSAIAAVARAGGRVTAAVTGSLLVLGAVSLGLVRLLGLA